MRVAWNCIQIVQLLKYLITLSNYILLFDYIIMTYQTSRNLDHITPTPAPEYRAHQREKTEEIFYSFKNKRENRDDYLTDPKVLKEALDEYEKIENWAWRNEIWDDYWVIWSESFYYRLLTDLNSEDQEILAKSNQADEFIIKLQNEILFFELKLARISPEKQSEFLSNSSLKPYHHFLEKQFASSKYLLSQEWEKVMNLFSKTSYENWESMTSKFLSKSQREIELPSWKKLFTLEELLTYTCDKNEDVRKQAIQAVNEIHSEAKEMAENEINSILEYKKTVDELRWFSNAEEFITLRDDISLETIHTMIDAVKDAYNFSHDFYRFKADLFWVKSFSYSEKTLQYWSLDKECPFDEAINLCQQTLWKWDWELLDIFNKSLENGMIDVFPHKWKRWWWFCTDNSIWLPTYVLINYTNKLRDASVLIHESWHYACEQFQRKNLNALQHWAPLSFAETPSTFYESLLQDSIEATLTNEELLVYRMLVLDDIVSAVPRQVAEYRFEQDLHKLFREKWYLWADEIGELFVKHMKDYTWDGIHYDEFDANRRISRSHNRMFFYVYSYAIGYLVSQFMLRKLKNWTLSIDQVKAFFSAWSSKNPEEIFMDMWIDITKKEFRNESLDSLKEYLNETKELAKKLGKI